MNISMDKKTMYKIGLKSIIAQFFLILKVVDLKTATLIVLKKHQNTKN